MQHYKQFAQELLTECTRSVAVGFGLVAGISIGYKIFRTAFLQQRTNIITMGAPNVKFVSCYCENKNEDEDSDSVKASTEALLAAMDKHHELSKQEAQPSDYDYDQAILAAARDALKK